MDSYIVTAASFVLLNGEEVGAASTENIRTNKMQRSYRILM